MNYYINVKTQKVHLTGCPYSFRIDKIFLENYSTPKEAVIAAKSKGYSNANGCHYCSSSAHKK